MKIRLITFQVDGPSHFNENKEYNATTKFQNKLFQKLYPNETMVRVSYFDIEKKGVNYIVDIVDNLLFQLSGGVFNYTENRLGKVDVNDGELV